MSQLIQLDETLYIASGVERHIYRHPTDDTKLLKVLRPQDEQGNRFTFRDITTRLMPSVRLRLIRKEYDEYIRIQLRHPSPDIRLPITHMFGLVQTSLGLACVAERVADENGGVGETMKQKVKNGTLSDADLGLFNAFVKQFYDLGIRAGDLKPHNIVFGYRDAGYECVLVDGFGDIHALPVRSLGQWANALGLNDSFKIVAQRTGLIWDQEDRSFSRTDGP